MKKRVISIFLMLIMVVTMLPMQVSASSTIKMTTYDQVYKTKNTVYCTGAGGIYKVTLKNGKVKKVKKLYKGKVYFEAYRSAACMKKKGDYLYFIVWNDSSPGGGILRVNVKTAKVKGLTGYVEYLTEYVIKDKKIYYSYEEEILDEYYDEEEDDYVILSDDFVEKTKSMSLSGKSKKKVNKKITMKTKKTNAKGYSTIVKKKGKYAKDYLKTPKGTFYLGKRKIKNSY